ncbi:MAG: hypothetical protein JXA33_27555 [Anaerolineae bacterium]|nr:hypothetical protein [Anaerolineae bacterium]
MQERGDLVQDGEGCWVAGAALDWATLPVRVEAVIAERIERLPEALQALLRVAGVEGETFTAEAVAQVQLYRMRGLLRLQQNEDSALEAEADFAEVEDDFRRAITAARRMEARMCELRATVCLARLWQQRGQREQAHQALAEIYGWSTEGFETRDLQEAKALLEELAVT